MMNQTIANWLISNDTGLSSTAIVAFMEGASSTSYFNYPRDPADLGRCIRLLALSPKYRSRFPKMAKVSEEWAALIAHWDELVALYTEELPSRQAPKCYDRMQELLRPIQDAKMNAYWEQRKQA